MRRRSNDPQKEVTLFVGKSRIIVLTKNKQIDYAHRTVQLTEHKIYTYHDQTMESSFIGSKSTLKNAAIEL